MHSDFTKVVTRGEKFDLEPQARNLDNETFLVSSIFTDTVQEPKCLLICSLAGWCCTRFVAAVPRMIKK